VDHDSYTAELFATVRILDFKCVVCGTDCLEAEFNLGKLFENPVIRTHSLRMQRWTRVPDLRKALLTVLWKDISTDCLVQRCIPL
jgi:hypothetical protein